MRKSEMLLGRRAARERFYRDGEVTLSAFDVLEKTKRFYVECRRDSKAGPAVLYRIRVIRKEK